MNLAEYFLKIGIIFPLSSQHKLFSKESVEQWAGSKTVENAYIWKNSPQCHFGMQIIFSWSQSSPKGLRKSFLSSRQLPKRNLDRGLVQKESYHHRQLQRIWARSAKLEGAQQGLFVQIPLCVPFFLHGMTNICSSHLLIDCLLFLWSPRPLSPS